MTTMDNKGLDLMAQIVDANVRNLAATTDRIIEDLEQQVRRLAATVVAINAVLADATVIDRATEGRLAMLMVPIENAYMTLDRMGER